MQVRLVPLGSMKLRHLWHRSVVLWGDAVWFGTNVPGSRRHMRSLSLGRVKMDAVRSPARRHVSVTAARASGLACCEGPDRYCLSRLFSYKTEPI